MSTLLAFSTIRRTSYFILLLSLSLEIRCQRQGSQTRLAAPHPEKGDQWHDAHHAHKWRIDLVRVPPTGAPMVDAAGQMRGLVNIRAVRPSQAQRETAKDEQGAEETSLGPTGTETLGETSP